MRKKQFVFDYSKPQIVVITLRSYYPLASSSTGSIIVEDLNETMITWDE